MLEPRAIGVALVDVAHDVRFALVDFAFDVAILAHVVVAEDATARDVALSGAARRIIASWVFCAMLRRNSAPNAPNIKPVMSSLNVPKVNC